MNVHLTAELDAYVRRKVESGLYGSASEVIREGLRLLARRDAEETLESLLLEGLAIGEATEMTSADWQGLRDEVRNRLVTRAPDA